MEKGDVVFLCDVVPKCNMYEIIELIIRTVGDDYAVGVDDKTKQAHLFKYDMFDKYVFATRADAVEALKVLRAENEND